MLSYKVISETEWNAIATPKPLTSKAVVRYQPEYICPWVTVVVFSDGFEHAVYHGVTKKSAQLARDKWSERESK